MLVGVVHNVAAGRSAESRGRAIERALGSRARVLMPRSRDELGDVARELRAAGIDVLAISGGDGTLHATLSAFHAEYGVAPLPALELLRGGTMNTVADSLRLPRGSKALLERLATRADQGPSSLRTVSRATMACEGRLAFLFGIGVIPTFLRAYYETGRPSPVTASRVLARAMVESLTGGALFARLTSRTEFEARFDDGERWAHADALAFAAGTIDDIGLGFRPFHRAHETDTRMHCLRVDATSAEFVRELPRIRRARPMSEGRSTDRLATGVTLVSRGEPFDYVMDGDIYRAESNELHVGLGPSVRFVVGH